MCLPPDSDFEWWGAIEVALQEKDERLRKVEKQMQPPSVVPLGLTSFHLEPQARGLSLLCTKNSTPPPDEDKSLKEKNGLTI